MVIVIRCCYAKWYERTITSPNDCTNWLQFQRLLKGLPTGTTSTTRVGNKVKAKYIKGSILLTANQENQSDDQGGEEVVNNTANGLQYLRTSWRVVIVKDTQSNSTDAQITWDQVFTSVGFKTNSWYGFNFNQPLASGSAITQDLLKGLPTGTTSTTASWFGEWYFIWLI